MRTPARLLLCTAVAGALMLPAGADPLDSDAPTEPTLRTEQTFFTCGDVNKVRTVNALQDSFDTWDTTAPTTSFQAGGGCGTTASPFADEELSGTWEGTFAGNLDRIAVEVHVIDTVALSRVPGESFAVTPALTIDGTAVPLRTGDFSFVELETTRSETNLTVRGFMTITNLNLRPEVGDGTQERTIRLRLAGGPVDQGAFVWDATEVPSGLTFNPPANVGTTVPKG